MRVSILIPLALGGVLWACGDNSVERPSLEPEASPPHEDDDPVTDGTSFEAEVYPILRSRCAGTGCHSNEPYSNGVGIAQSGIVMARRHAETSISRILSFVGETGALRMPPPPADPVTDEELVILSRWRDDGFPP